MMHEFVKCIWGSRKALYKPKALLLLSVILKRDGHGISAKVWAHTALVLACSCLGNLHNLGCFCADSRDRTLACRKMSEEWFMLSGRLKVHFCSLVWTEPPHIRTGNAVAVQLDIQWNGKSRPIISTSVYLLFDSEKPHLSQAYMVIVNYAKAKGLTVNHWLWCQSPSCETR